MLAFWSLDGGFDVGPYVVTVKGKGNYTGAKKLKFKVTPKGTEFTKVTGGPQQIALKWKRQKGITGYQIQYGLKKDFSDGKTLKVKDDDTVTKTIKELKAERTYYLRIRTYKQVGNEMYVSDWSGTASAKTQPAEKKKPQAKIKVDDTLDLKTLIAEEEANSVEK